MTENPIIVIRYKNEDGQQIINKIYTNIDDLKIYMMFKEKDLVCMPIHNIVEMMPNEKNLLEYTIEWGHSLAG